MKLGITLFSLTLEWLSGRYTLDQLLAEVKRRDLGPGLEVVGFQTIRGFPQIDSDFAMAFRKLLDKYELVATCLGANVDLAIRRDRKLTDDETVEYLAAQIQAAQTLGFPVLRMQINAKPMVMRKLAPLAERAGVVMGMELHSPYGVHHPAVHALRELYDEMQSPSLGYIPDMGTSMHQIPPGIIESFRAQGIKDVTISALNEIWRSNLAAPEKFAQMRERAMEQDATPRQLGNLNLALSMFGTKAPEDWLELMPRTVHIHGKFYGFDENGNESSIDYGRIVKVFRDGGFQGFMSSEWEGHAFTDAFSGFNMVAQHQKLCRRFLSA